MAMGASRCYSEILPLERMIPSGKLASSGFCLADTTPGEEQFLVWVPAGRVRVDLSGVKGRLECEWLGSENGEARHGTPVAGAATVTESVRGSFVPGNSPQPIVGIPDFLLGTPLGAIVGKPDERLMVTTGRRFDRLGTGEHQFSVGGDGDLCVPQIRIF